MTRDQAIVRTVHPHAHAARKTRRGHGGAYWCVFSRRVAAMRLATGDTQAEAWKKAAAAIISRHADTDPEVAKATYRPVGQPGE